MIITWYGHSCFKIQSGEIILITDPFDKSIGLTPPRGQVNIVTISHHHYDHDNLETLIAANPFVIDGPGEYEIKGINVMGLATFHDNKQGQERGNNTAYLIEVEGIKICHLGDLGQEKLTDEQLEFINGVDILIIPVGGVYTIDGEQAVRIINQIEPKIVIPMHYKIPGLNIKLDGVDAFLKEIGMTKIQPVDKLTVKKKDLLEKEETEVVVMKI